VLVLRAIAVATLVAAAVVHARVVDEHLQEWWLEGAFFFVLQVVETLLAFALAFRPSRSLYLVTVAVSLGTVALWLVSRTVGVPVGPGAGEPEAVGTADLVATACELATAFALLPLVARRSLGRVAVATTVALAVAGVAVAATGGAASGVAGEHGHGHDSFTAPGEYPLGKPLQKPTRTQGRGFYFATQPLLRYVVELGVGPDVPGINTLDVIVIDRAGKRIEVPRIRVTVAPPGGGLRARPYAAHRISPGHFIVDFAHMPVAGTWSVRVDGRPPGARATPFSYTFAVPIAARSRG
jgi:hypothetical protein